MLPPINKYLKRALHTLGLYLGIFVALSAKAVTSTNNFDEQSLEQLEMRLSEIDAERSRLAKLTFRQGVGNLGWLSAPELHSQQQQWIEVQLPQETRIDAIALVPVLWQDADQGILPDSFPEKFQIVAGTQEDTVGHVVASFDSAEQASSRIAPFTFPITPIKVSWLRIEFTKATKAVSDGKYLIQIAELLVFNGQAIVSIDAEVKASTFRKTRVDKAHTSRSLIDGFTPYLMDVKGTNSQSYVAFYKTTTGSLEFNIDLGLSHSIDCVHLHAADLSENVPKIQHADYAFPKELIIEGANQADFSDAVFLCKYERVNIYEAGPIIIKQFPQNACRYVRFTVVEGYKAPEAKKIHRCVGFAEIELFANQKNVALNRPFEVSWNAYTHDGQLSALTDGRNHFGPIIPYREWIEQLAYRADLETKRPDIMTELGYRYAKQKTNIRILSWTTGLLTIGIIFAILINRILSMRREAQLKERFAADLHDEIGADLYTIGLLSDLADDARANPNKLSKLLQQIRSNTEESGQTVRKMVQLQSGIHHERIETMMKQTAERNATHLEHEISILGDQHLHGLKPSTHSDLLSFYKECLVNVCRHSDATRLRTQLIATSKKIDLTVSDNGQGISKAAKDWAPKSLKRRAKLLGAKVQLEESNLGGTKIHLTVRHSLFAFTIKQR